MVAWCRFALCFFSSYNCNYYTCTQDKILSHNIVCMLCVKTWTTCRTFVQWFQSAVNAVLTSIASTLSLNPQLHCDLQTNDYHILWLVYSCDVRRWHCAVYEYCWYLLSVDQHTMLLYVKPLLGPQRLRMLFLLLSKTFSFRNWLWWNFWWQYYQFLYHTRFLS